jgi:Fe-S-cluster-containing dehydrogenase component/formate-dependent nitrite reductase membrane component NrfD
MPTFGFVIDNRKCIGCHACTVACKSEHQVPIGVDRTWVKYIEKGTFPHNRRLFTVMRCNHCDHAPCVTICPVTALHRRDDGVVDFNNERCIGCKACLQACPYDALYIDPDTHTAAKCNFCTHRLEVGLQPSCVAVCPEQAIIAGDLDDPQSNISLLLGRHPVQVRKPEKGTRPKLFYIEADAASLVPAQTAVGERFLWSTPATGNGNGEADGTRRQALPLAEPDPSPRRVYDVRPRRPSWGWHVAAYTWTKSIAAGAFLAVTAAGLLPGAAHPAGFALTMGLVCLVFLALTAALLVADLEKPGRFLYVLLRPQWRSWLVRGAYLLTGFGLVVSLWLLALLAGAPLVADVLSWPGVLLAAGSAVYTAFLFAQAKGRDLWQNPLLGVNLLAHALLAGGAVWLIVDVIGGVQNTATARVSLAATLAFSLVSVLAEIWTTPPTADAHRALRWIVGRAMGRWFWGAGIVAGHLLPLVLLAVPAAPAALAAAVLALVGLYVVERLWVLAPQYIPLS